MLWTRTSQGWFQILTWYVQRRGRSDFSIARSADSLYACIAEQTTGKMSTNELLKGLTALREKVDPSVLEQTLKGAPTQSALLVARCIFDASQA
eukprot:COSAG02_NODE_2223_length_9455_cov_5.513675_3_plen_94_part_00